MFDSFGDAVVAELTPEISLSSDFVGCSCFSLLSMVTVSSISKLVLPSCLEMEDSHKCAAVERISMPGLSEGRDPDERVGSGTAV